MSKAANGVLYLPAPTITGFSQDNAAVEARELVPKETSSPSNTLHLRGLTNPHHDYNGTSSQYSYGVRAVVDACRHKAAKTLLFAVMQYTDIKLLCGR